MIEGTEGDVSYRQYRSRMRNGRKGHGGAYKCRLPSLEVVEIPTESLKGGTEDSGMLPGHDLAPPFVSGGDCSFCATLFNEVRASTGWHQSLCSVRVQPEAYIGARGQRMVWPGGGEFRGDE